MTIKINNIEYDVIKNVKDAINVEDLETCLTDYFDSFDYILGDYAYGKLRLKGFNNKENKNFKPIMTLIHLMIILKIFVPKVVDILLFQGKPLEITFFICYNNF